MREFCPSDPPVTQMSSYNVFDYSGCLLQEVYVLVWSHRLTNAKIAAVVVETDGAREVFCSTFEELTDRCLSCRGASFMFSVE